jgi:hypothetical protein
MVMLAQDWGRGLTLSEFELGLKADGLPGLSGEETKLRELSDSQQLWLLPTDTIIPN